MTRLINNNVYIFIFISMLFYAPKIQAAYVPTDILLNNYKVKPRSIVCYSNNSFNVKDYRLQKIYNNYPRPCETCKGKFYIVKNETFSKNFSIIRDTVNNLLYVDKVTCKDIKTSWNVKYPCNNHVYTIKFVNPEWEWKNKDIQIRKQIDNEYNQIETKQFIIATMVMVIFCFLMFIIIVMFNSKEQRKIINKYTSPFIIGGIMMLVFGVLTVAVINFPTNYVNNESQYCISVVDADSTLTDSLIYQIDSIYHK